MKLRRLTPFLVLSFLLEARANPPLKSAPDGAPSTWTSGEVYQILHNSPWTRVVKMSFPAGGSLTQNDSSPSGPPPPTTGMGGRRGGRSAATYSSGGGNRSSSSSSSKTAPTEVLIQWQSATVVRIAAGMKAGEKVDSTGLKPLDDYVIGVVGLPITFVGGPAASAEVANTLSAEQQERVENNVKSSASIIRPGHEALTPTKVELDQGADGRMLIHFAKTDPITESEKSVEFKLGSGKSELRKKFPLKEMEYQGKLEL